MPKTPGRIQKVDPLMGGSYKVPLVSIGPKLGDLLSTSSRGSGKGQGGDKGSGQTVLGLGFG